MRARATLGEAADVCGFLGALVVCYAVYRVMAWAGRWPHGGAGGGDDDTPQCEASYPGIPGTCIFTEGPQHPDHHQAPDGWKWSR